MTKLLETYKIMVDFLADYLGEDTEVVLHDLTAEGKGSIVAIRNGSISGRTIGTPMTDFANQLIKNKVYEKQPYCVNYKGISPRGEAIRSATLFILNDDNILEGLLCINMNCQKMLEVRDFLNHFLSVTESKDQLELTEENFNIDPQALVDENLMRIFPAGSTIVFETLNKREKIDVCEKLQEMGTFLVKGTVSYTAEKLCVSVPTVYRYLAEIKKKNEDKSFKSVSD